MNTTETHEDEDCEATRRSMVFLSYKREDELRVGKIAEALKAEGYKPWWGLGDRSRIEALRS